MPAVTPAMKEETKEIIYNFYSEECNVDRNTLNENTNVIEDIGGDSLMFLELLSLFKKKYGINVEIKSIGKYVLKHPSATLGKILDLTLLIIEHGDKIADLA
ncbi:MAG: acyl carrier protein [Candidatus Brocadiae bacterium]|nr:acyl carrier protein [Candidatus Brocadiia bacterium]